MCGEYANQEQGWGLRSVVTDHEILREQRPELVAQERHQHLRSGKVGITLAEEEEEEEGEEEKNVVKCVCVCVCVCV